MRSVVSYDDLERVTTMPASGPPPAKKRKRQQNRRKSLGSHKFAHWDEPGENHDVSFTNRDYADDPEDETVDAESRELTHQEIWDDSALVEAWDAAMDEYKAFHGSEDKWKTEPISKPSPLWYNVPPGDPGPKLPPPVPEHDSIPLNFNTFVPSHDPTLTNLATADTQSLAGISQDEAFRNALNAMYWTGYWTAVYHCRSAPDELLSEKLDDTGSCKDEPVGRTMDEFVTSQR